MTLRISCSHSEQKEYPTTLCNALFVRSFTLKTLPIFLLLIALTGCKRPVQRFVPMGDDTALDTKTGRRCSPDPMLDPSRKPQDQYPLCYDLYKEW